MLFNVDKNFVLNGVSFGILKMCKDHKQLFDEFLFDLKLFEDNVSYDQSFFVNINSMASKTTIMLYKVLNKCLCIFVYNKTLNNLKLQIDPIGKHKDKLGAYEEILKILKKCNKDFVGNFSIVREMNANYKNVVSGDEYSTLKLTSKDMIYDVVKDMIYDVVNNISLEGSDYSTFRRNLSRAQRYHEPFMFEYEKEMFNDVMSIYHQWKEIRSVKYDRFYDSRSIEYMLLNADDLGLTVYVCYVGDKPVGYSTVCKLCSDAMQMNQRKSLDEYSVNEFIWHSGLKDYYENVESLKYENDGGFDKSGLYNFKKRFNPIAEFEYYELIKKSNSKK